MADGRAAPHSSTGGEDSSPVTEEGVRSSATALGPRSHYLEGQEHGKVCKSTLHQGAPGVGQECRQTATRRDIGIMMCNSTSRSHGVGTTSPEGQCPVALLAALGQCCGREALPRPSNNAPQNTIRPHLTHLDGNSTKRQGDN